MTIPEFYSLLCSKVLLPCHMIIRIRLSQLKGGVFDMPSNSLEDSIRNFLTFVIFILTSMCTIIDCIDKLRGHGLYTSASKTDDEFTFDESSLYDNFNDVFGKGSAESFKKKHKKNKKKKGKKKKQPYGRLII